MNKPRGVTLILSAVLLVILLTAAKCGGTGQRAIYYFGQNPPAGYAWNCHKRNPAGICVIFVRYQ